MKPNETIYKALELLGNAVEPQYSIEVAQRKILVAQVLALVAIAQELEKLNDLKERGL